ncbi:DUF7674 family protein [Pseudoduganella violaceinigra]|uniref:DUF7674 family protein n=1 Tax=Pseudoduganella violaceinigra TaxID=246602 RepID=UPI0012B658A8|nr:hypothetical protein [Pseudoduganella violaceinigra]
MVAMTEMSIEYLDEKDVVIRIRNRFPGEADRTDAWLRERGWDDLNEVPYVWIEAFADRTSDAVRLADWNMVIEHTKFLAAEYRKGSDAVRKLVDVAYAENLMWNLGAEDKTAGWPNIAKEVRALYEKTWGAREWMHRN